MGQAKKRGTYEERKASAIHDAELVRTILLKHENEWWDSLSKEEQDKHIEKRTKQVLEKNLQQNETEWWDSLSKEEQDKILEKGTKQLCNGL